MRHLPSSVLAASLLTLSSVAAAQEGGRTVSGIVEINEKGATIRSVDDAYALRIRAVLQTDLRLFVNDEHRYTDQFLFRRARLYVEGKASRVVTFRLMPDFGNGQTVLYDAWVDLRAIDALRLRIGKAKPPFGLERLQNDTSTTFAERAQPTSIAPNRDIGVELHGDLFEQTVSYSLGVFNGVGDNGLSDGDIDDPKELGARIEVGPFSHLSSPHVSKLRLGFAITRGKETGNATSTYLSTYRTFGQNAFFTWLTDTTGNTPANNALAAGMHNRGTFQLYWPTGPLALLAELTETEQHVARQSQTRGVHARAWNATASYVLTGEDASFDGPTPTHPFDWSKRRFGAVELAARASELHLSDNAFPLLADPTKSARDATEWVVGVNWYPTAQLKMVANFARSTFESGGPGHTSHDPEQVFILRAQFAF